MGPDEHRKYFVDSLKTLGYADAESISLRRLTPGDGFHYYHAPDTLPKSLVKKFERALFVFHVRQSDNFLDGIQAFYLDPKGGPILDFYEKVNQKWDKEVDHLSHNYMQKKLISMIKQRNEDLDRAKSIHAAVTKQLQLNKGKHL